MMHCIAIDDEPLALEVLKKYASAVTEINLVAVFSDPVLAQEYLNDNPVDLIFLDIRMPDINGFALYTSLAIKPMVIFTTAYKEYAIDGFEVAAIDYLLKPFTPDRFKKAVEKALNQGRIQAVNRPAAVQYLYVHADYKLQRIAINDICYIEAMDDYAKINTATQSYMTQISMKAILEKLPRPDFIRIHRSYIVAAKMIAFIQFRKIGLDNGLELPVGDTYRKGLAELRP